MNVFLTGATGYIGSAVAEALRAAGHGVTALVRSETGARRVAEQGVAAQMGDLSDPRAAAAAAASADALVHTAFGRDASAPLADEAFVDAALGAFAGSGKPFIYTSGVWVMGNTSEGADEDSPTAPPPVVAWRVAVENKVRTAAAAGIRTVVLRPAMVYGRGGGIVASFLQSARETGAALMVGDGRNHWTFVHVDDLADLYVRALGAETGSLFIGASGPALRVTEVAAEASRTAGAEGRVQEWIPEEASHVLGPVVQGLVLDQKVSGKRAQRLLGWTPHAASVKDDLKHGSYAGR